MYICICMYVCMYVSMYVCMYICIYIYIYGDIEWSWTQIMRGNLLLPFDGLPFQMNSIYYKHHYTNRIVHTKDFSEKYLSGSTMKD